MNKISIVVVTYNSSKHIYDCLDSVFKYNDIGDDLEVIVVDNDSQEQLPMFDGIRTKYGEKVILINSGRNGGYGYGNNVGVQYSSSDVVIVMNPDVRLITPIFGKLLSKMEDKTIGLIGVSFIDGSIPFYIKPECVNLWNQLIHPLRIWFKNYNEIKMYMSGSFLVFRKKAYEESGRFDENIFMYTEEPDITNRIQDKGYHAIWSSEIQVKHLAHGRGFNLKTEEITTQSLKYYAVKHNMDLHHNIRVKIKLLEIKRVIAKFVNNKFKAEIFDQRIIYLRQLQNTM